MLCDESNRFWSPAFFLLLCVAYCCNKQDYDLLPNTRTPTANWFSLLLLLLPLLYRILKTVEFLFSFFFFFCFFVFIPLRLEQTFAFLVQALLVSPNVHTHSLHFASYNATSRSANKHYKIGYNRRRDPNVAFSAITGKQIQQLSSAQHYGEKKEKKIYEVLPICTTTFLSFSSLISFFNPCIFTISTREFASTIHLQTTSKQTDIAVCSETGGLLSKYHAKNARMLKFVQNFNVKTMRTYTT